MVGLAIPLTLVRQRRSPIRQPVRDLRISQAEDVVLQVSVYDREGDAAPFDLRYARIYFVLERERHDRRWWDYGVGGLDCRRPLLVWTINNTGAGTLQAPDVVNSPSAALPRADLYLPGSITSNWRGRYTWALQADIQAGTSTLLGGALDVRPTSPQSQLLQYGGLANSTYDVANFDQATFAPEVLQPPTPPPSNQFDSTTFDQGTFGP